MSFFSWSFISWLQTQTFLQAPVYWVNHPKGVTKRSIWKDSRVLSLVADWWICPPSWSNCRCSSKQVDDPPRGVNDTPWILCLQRQSIAISEQSPLDWANTLRWLCSFANFLLRYPPQKNATSIWPLTSYQMATISYLQNGFLVTTRLKPSKPTHLCLGCDVPSHLPGPLHGLGKAENLLWVIFTKDAVNVWNRKSFP